MDSHHRAICPCLLFNFRPFISVTWVPLIPVKIKTKYQNLMVSKGLNVTLQLRPVNLSSESHSYCWQNILTPCYSVCLFLDCMITVRCKAVGNRYIVDACHPLLHTQLLHCLLCTTKPLTFQYNFIVKRFQVQT